MKKTIPFAPALALAIVLSASMMMGIPPVPHAADALLKTTDNGEDPEAPKRIFDRRIAWGPLPDEAIMWAPILAQYGE